MESKDKVFYESLETDRKKQNELNNSIKKNKSDLKMQVPPIAKSLRIIQLLFLVIFLSIVVYLINLKKSTSEKPTLSIIFFMMLLILATVYVFLVALDLISQLDGRDLPDTLMISFSFLGFILFAIKFIMMIFYVIEINSHFMVVVLLSVCMTVMILFLIDLVLCLSFWKRKYLDRMKCYPYNGDKDDGQDVHFLPSRKTSNHKKECICDISTSISNVMQPVIAEDFDNDHIYRKIGIGRRRMYADCSASTPSLDVVETVHVQTEPKKILVAECQTHRCELKETPVQTSNQPAQNNFRINRRQNVTFTPQACSICPAVLQLMRGGLPTQCFTICRCGEGTVIHEHEQQLQYLQSLNHEESTIGPVLNECREVDQATCPCIPFKIDLSSQETNSTKYTTNLSITSISIKNHKKIQKSLNEISESNEKDSKTIPETQFGDEKIDCLDQNKKIITDNSYQIEQASLKKKNAKSVEIKSISDEVRSDLMTNGTRPISEKTANDEIKIIQTLEINNIPEKVMQSLNNKDTLIDEKIALSQEVIRISQEIIDKAEESLSAPGSYSRPHRTFEVPDPTNFSCPKLDGLFQKRNKVEPLNFNKFNKSHEPFAKETVLKLRLPTEMFVSESKIFNTNQEQNNASKETELSNASSKNQIAKQLSDSENLCTCITRSKRTHKLCAIQVQYIFQDPKGRIVCKSCATPESMRIPQKISCCAQKCLKCFECKKVLSPPCECSACNTKINI